MRVLNNMFKWFTAKDKGGQVVNLGYVLEGEPTTMEEVERLFEAFKLSKYLPAIQPLIRHKIDLNLVPKEEVNIGVTKSKIGGRPNLMDDEEWPKNEQGKSLSFIGQLNLEEVSMHDKSGLLPKRGLLSFFYCADQEAWGV